MTDRQELVIVSNRGPFSFEGERPDQLQRFPAAGGLASALAPVADQHGVAWVAAAISAGDRWAAQQDDAGGPIRLRLLPFEPEVYRRFYGDIANATLWFLHHGIFDRARRPNFDADWYRSWAAFQSVNKSFAVAVARHAPRGAIVLVQDFHLALVGRELAQRRPDLQLVHFTHTPLASPSDLRLLPNAVAHELLDAMQAYAACGFHCDRWEAAFLNCCDEVIRARPRTFVAPLGPHREALVDMANSDICTAYRASLHHMIGQRHLILRVDRMDPAKNLLRGFLAYDELLAQHPQWRGEVVFLALAQASRQSIPEYASYQQEVEKAVAYINGRWATPGWQPIILNIGDSAERSVAALTRYDVLLVNSVRDGLNLVAKEGALINEVDGAIVLSRESGAWSEMHLGTLGIDPFDVSQTRFALHQALEMPAAARHAMAENASIGASASDGSTWLAAQLDAVRMADALGAGSD